MSIAYAAAYEAHNVAIQAFDIVRNAFRAGLVDDAAFFAAKAEMVKADAAFDLAYNLSCEEAEAAEAAAMVEVVDDSQLAMF